MAEQTEKVFVAGMYLDRVHPNAPEFIITNQTIHVEKFIQWLQENKHLASDKGYLRLVGKESQTKDDKGLNKRYFEVDTWKPAPKDETPAVTPYPTADINPEDQPW
jgi:hypothetical protein